MTPNVLILDVETLTSNKGNPFDLTNRLVCVGLKTSKGVDIIYDHEQFLDRIQNYIDDSDLIIGFNIKFDCHWIRKIGIDISKIRVWDCQLAEFLLNHQSTPYPSLDQAAEKYGFNKKLDVVKLEYWDKGIDTDKIPREILSDYLTQDLVLTQQVYEKQVEQFKTNGLLPLFKLQCADLLVLEEMEWQGIRFNTEKALEKANTIEKELDEISTELSRYTGGVPINFNSNDHVSCLLYGGIIKEDIRIPVGVYKTGDKTGQTRYKIITKEYTLPRLVEPLEKTATKWEKINEKVVDKDKPTHWKVNETILRSLKLNKEAKIVVNLLDKYGKLDKLKGTYLIGYSELIKKMNWPKDMLYGNLNMCVAVTGRLASSKPNLQNVDPATKTFMVTRY